jgi:hypothetical protein
MKLIPIILLLVFISLGSYILGTKNSTTSKQTAESYKDELSITSFSSPINYGDAGSYLSFRIKFPSKYIATTDSMITYYKTQGGMAPPALMLTADYQPLAKSEEEDQQYVLRYKEIENSGHDCILVWNTVGFSSFEDWYNNIQNEQFDILSEEKQKINNFNVVKRAVMNKETHAKTFQALIQLPSEVTYYLYTCNETPQKDLQTVLENLEIRGII